MPSGGIVLARPYGGRLIVRTALGKADGVGVWFPVAVVALLGTFGPCFVAGARAHYRLGAGIGAIIVRRRLHALA